MRDIIVDDSNPGKILAMIMMSGIGLFPIGHVCLSSFNPSRPNQDKRTSNNGDAVVDDNTQSDDNEDKTYVCLYLTAETLLRVWKEYCI